MRGRWVIIALLLLAAASPDETKQFRAARAAFDDKLYDVAEREFSDFLQKSPASEHADNAQYHLGLAQLNQDKWDAAALSLQEALTKWPDKRPDTVRFWLGEAFARGGRYAEAATRYSEVLEKYPASTYRQQSFYGLAFAQFKLGRLDVAALTLGKLAP